MARGAAYRLAILARVSNGPTEALNSLVKRIGFGYRNFENYRMRALLYAGRPNCRVLGSIVVRRASAPRQILTSRRTS